MLIIFTTCNLMFKLSMFMYYEIFVTFFVLKETQEYTRNVVRYCLEALQDWFDAINFVDEVSLCIYYICLKIGCVGD